MVRGLVASAEVCGDAMETVTARIAGRPVCVLFKPWRQKRWHTTGETSARHTSRAFSWLRADKAVAGTTRHEVMDSSAA